MEQEREGGMITCLDCEHNGGMKGEETERKRERANERWGETVKVCMPNKKVKEKRERNSWSWGEVSKHETLYWKEIERKEKNFIYQSTSYLPSLFNINKLNSKFIGFKSLKTSALNANTLISSYASGINMKLAGRLMTQRMRPRFTVQMKQNGSLARVKVDYVEKSRFTSKNKRGAFSFSVSIGHIIK